LTNFQKKKKDFLGQKNKLGLSLRRKKRIFAPKIANSQKKRKKGTFPNKKKSWG